MFLDIDPSEFLLTAVVAVVVIGPKDLPRAMRVVGKWLGQMRRISGHFRSGIETMIREAELEDMEKKWREQNEAIMKANPPAMTALPAQVIEAGPTEPLAPGEHDAAVAHHETPVTHHDAPSAAASPGEGEHASPAQRPEILS
jgi:sec-independent protein translocase protein TatB